MVIFEISADAAQLNEFIQVFGQRFIGLIDNQNVYYTYRVPNPEAPYPQDYIIDQQGIVRYWSDEYDPREIINVIDALLDTNIDEYDEDSGGVGLRFDISPNPFHVSVEISVSSPEFVPGLDQGTLSIHDAAGRLIKTFPMTASYSVLPAVFSWDGTDVHGNPVPSGVYFIRFNAGIYTVTDTVVLVN